MSSLFQTIDKIKPVYDRTYAFVMFLCKLLLTVDILITCMAVAGRYIPFIPDPAWSEEVVLTCMAYMAVLSAALAIRRNAHIRMTAFDTYLPKQVVRALDILSDAAVLAHHDYRGLEVCKGNWLQGLLREHALAVQVLDVFPGSPGRRGDADI